ncbi:MAG: thiosulfate oxidation carrier complex protein SoxZ [Pseudomonadota bacterium]|jgi:sulfur-oxidizing protein SoxZ
MARVLLQVPASARRGEVIELRVTLAHPMETGHRPGTDGRPVPRDIVHDFSCRYNGELVFSAQLHPAIAANPYLAFHTVATESGTLEFAWRGDHGFAHVERRTLQVT